MAEVLVAAMVLLWLLLATKPSAYLRALFVTAPWMGLNVLLRWQFDLFKVGLLLAPFVLLRTYVPRRKRKVVFLAAALAALALAHLAWQLASHEIEAHDVVRATAAADRLTVAFGMFALRLTLFVFLLAAIRSVKDADTCLRAYSASVFVLACYGLVQEVVYLVTGHPVTPIYRAGILNEFSEYTTVQVGSVSLLRIYAFSGEPKDFALFAVPAIAYLGFRALLRPGEGNRLWAGVELATILAAAFFTLSSSFLLMLPLLVIAACLPSALGHKRIRVALLVVAVSALIWPVWSSLSAERVFRRFQHYDDLLQVSRERPALAFWLDNLPRSLLGFSVGGQAYYVPSRMTAEFMQTAQRFGNSVGVDSFWLSVLLDLGVPGVALVLAIVWASLFNRSMTVHSLPVRAAALSVALMCIPLQGDLRSALLWLMTGAGAGALGAGRGRRAAPCEVLVYAPSQSGAETPVAPA